VGTLRAVLFDWDGTLADTAEATFHCYAKVFGSFGIAFDRQRFAETYSPDWQRTYLAVGLPRERWPDADSAWLDAYACQESPLLPSARECLERLSSRVRLGLVTSGDRGRVIGELERHGLTGVFAAAVFGGEVPERKPHPAALLVALERLGVAPAESAYVGDAPEDIQMARAACAHYF
jgi:phosphoglycolate phosphatase